MALFSGLDSTIGLIVTKYVGVYFDSISMDRRNIISGLKKQQWLQLLDDTNKNFAATVFLIWKYKASQAFYHGDTFNIVNKHTWHEYREEEVKYWKHYLDSISKNH